MALKGLMEEMRGREVLRFFYSSSALERSERPEIAN